jgi:4-hydroxy-3-polyprenylbenzoate decarboxylase
MSTFVVGLSGGSGVRYGLRLLEVLLRADHRVHLVATGAAFRVLRYEAGIEVDAAQLPQLVDAALRDRLTVHAIDRVEAAPASGSGSIDGVVLCPCSMGTLARVTHGISSNLLERAADVALKQRRPLVVVPRETPLPVVHLRNMLALAEAGAIVLPACPGFYHRPQTIDDLVDFVVGRVLDALGLDHELVARWTTPATSPRPSAWDEGEV